MSRREKEGARKKKEKEGGGSEEVGRRKLQIKPKLPHSMILTLLFFLSSSLSLLLHLIWGLKRNVVWWDKEFLLGWRNVIIVTIGREETIRNAKEKLILFSCFRQTTKILFWLWWETRLQKSRLLSWISWLLPGIILWKTSNEWRKGGESTVRNISCLWSTVIIVILVFFSWTLFSSLIFARKIKKCVTARSRCQKKEIVRETCNFITESNAGVTSFFFFLLLLFLPGNSIVLQRPKRWLP